MARNEVISRQMLPEAVGDVSMSDSHDVHVLAVDDSLIDRTVIERLLKITSCKVTAVDSGRRALQFLGLGDDKSSVGFNGLKVDMIITDYCMPGMTGYELLKKVKESSDFREIPVVIMSSENIVARIDRCLEEGAEDFIVKPVKLSDVKRLKDYMFGEDGIVRENLGARGIINKRKLEQISDDPYDSSSSPQFVSSPSSSRQSDSAPSSLQSDSAPSSPQSNSSPSSSSLLELTPSSSPPNSPSPLESPTRRLKMTNCD